MRYYFLILFSFISLVASAQQETSDTYKYGIQKGDKRIIQLKNGYMLIDKDEDNDTIPATIMLQHGKIIKKLYAFFNIWVWVEMDGSNYFMTGSGGRGSGNPMKLDVFRKSSGANVFSTLGYPFYEDTLEGIIVFADEDKNIDYFTLYNLNSNKCELYKEPKDNGCTMGFCPDSVIVTRAELKIIYKDTAEKTKTESFNRIR
jgi:hypothetical protein